jgi:hypothetical protein
MYPPPKSLFIRALLAAVARYSVSGGRRSQKKALLAAVAASKFPIQPDRGTDALNPIVSAVESIYKSRKPNAPQDPVYLMSVVEEAWEFYQKFLRDPPEPRRRGRRRES